MNIAQLIGEISRKAGWSVSEENGEHVLTLTLEGDRRQDVRASAFDDEGNKMLRLTTTIGDSKGLDADRYRKALEVNFRLPHGCLALDGGRLVMTETRPLQADSLEATTEAIRFIARQADSYEKFIFGTDKH